MVSLASLDYEELGRCLLAAVVSGGMVWTIFAWFLPTALHSFGLGAHAQSRWMELVVLLAGTMIWLAVADVVLRKSGSALPRVMRKRLKLA
jgi:putative peptidoglycan lipid II flippase